ncbi:Self-incomp_S1 domain-containing protein [Cephalotus follicularis]|uniref:S-protein homolog n=1 Tax=Cephalotus follicularis TaxID=3775 RepID=A0A1Q3B7T6_CEPFO|nr:Self-incomp_S1 domain-containing protein [Cephalotus follicularis]
MKQNTLSRFYFCMFLLAIYFGKGTCWEFKRYHVRISNYLTGNKKLDVHCKSRDDDLGLHSLYRNDTYEFGFRINYFGTTLFFCHLWYDNFQVVFDAFVSKDNFILMECGDRNCNWEAQDGGIYLHNYRKNENVLKYKWG